MLPSLSATLSVLLLALSLSPSTYIVPSFRDATVRTRTGSSFSTTEQTLYLHGPRARTEFRLQDNRSGNVISMAHILQCDARQSIRLDLNHQTFAVDRLDNLGERFRAGRSTPPSQRQGGDVNITVETTDTGERRQIGGYTIRHLHVTTKVAPEAGACTHSSVQERDGWYLEASGLGCTDEKPVAVSTLSAGFCSDRIHVDRVGEAQSGYPIEELIRREEAGRSLPDVKTELVAFTVAPLDASLFEQPRNFRPALETPYGYDMSKADSVTNRANYYWKEMGKSIWGWFH
jgi:hypothetical protein